MATKNMAYDQPSYTVRHSSSVLLVATAASTSVRKWLAFTALKVKSINMLITIAGTATGAGYDILNGTTSVGNITLGTGTALSAMATLTQDILLTSGSWLDIKTAAASATMAAEAAIEFEIVPGANVSL